MKSYHVGIEGGTRSRKQIRIEIGLWNHDQIVQNTQTLMAGTPLAQDKRYLHRSAKIMRDGLQTSPSWQTERKKLEQHSVRLDTHDVVLLLDEEDLSR